MQAWCLHNTTVPWMQCLHNQAAPWMQGSPSNTELQEHTNAAHRAITQVKCWICAPPQFRCYASWRHQNWNQLRTWAACMICSQGWVVGETIYTWSHQGGLSNERRGAYTNKRNTRAKCMHHIIKRGSATMKHNLCLQTILDISLFAYHKFCISGRVPTSNGRYASHPLEG